MSIDDEPDNRGDLCDVCGSIPQKQQERYTEFQCGSSQNRDGSWHRKVACSVIARLKERVAELEAALRTIKHHRAPEKDYCREIVAMAEKALSGKETA